MSGHLRIVQVCGGEFFPAVGGGKTVEPQQRRTVEDDVTDLDHALKPYEFPLVHFISSEQLGVVAKVSQEPVQLPQSFVAAIESARKKVARKPAGLKNGQG